MSASDLKDLHIADLHDRASAAGIEGFRLLGREDLIKAIETGKRRGKPSRKASGVDSESKTDELKVLEETDGSDDESEERPARRRRRRGGRGRGGRERLGGDRGSKDEGGKREAPADEETEEITGVLEITRQRHGFLQVEGSDDDVYVSASQVRRCELKDGDEVTGPARDPRRGERHRALVRVNSVNGEEPVSAPAPKRSSGGGRGPDKFDSLTPVPPERRIPVPADAPELVRAADLLAPLAYGQRVLVSAAPRSGRTTLLRGLAQALAQVDDLELTVLLIDERPEEAPAWEQAVPGADLALAPADLSPRDQVKVAKDTLDRARRAASEGKDAVILCDSLSRLAVAAGGVDEVKRLFGSGRELSEENSGSLTVIATTLGEDDEASADKAVRTTETSIIVLDPALASDRVTPALVFSECRTVGEENLLADDELEGLRYLRSNLAEVVPAEAAALMRKHLDTEDTNPEILRSLA